MVDIPELNEENKLLRRNIKSLNEEMRELKYIKQQLEFIVNKAPVIIYMLDERGIFTMSEGAALAALNLKPGQVVGMSVFDVYKDFPEIIEAHKRTYQGEEVNFSLDTVGVQKTDSERDRVHLRFEIKTIPMKNAENKTDAVIGTAVNTTPMMIIQDKLQQSERKYRTLITEAPFGILVLQNNVCKYANPEFLSMFGYSREEILELPGIDLLAPSVRGALLKRYQSREKGQEEPTSYTSRGLKKNGEEFPIQVDARQIIWNDEPAVMVFYKDLTEIEKLSEEREKLKEQLLLSQKLESLGVVAGGVAHDFNNLLLGIMGNASFIESNPYDENNKEYAAEIRKISKEAANLTKQMLTYTGKTDLNPEYKTLNEIINETSKLIRISVPKTIIIDYSLTNNLSFIRVDVSQIKQVILNLVINASEAIGDENGKITITTGVQKIDDNYQKQMLPVFELSRGRYSTIEVTDTGCGIEKSIMNKIFDPFFSTKFTGRGLGLSVVMGIIQAHEGGISVYSDIDVGTTIKVLLPEVPGKPSMVKQKKEIGKIKLDSNILFCDDDEQILKLGKNMIERLGMNVSLASNGQEAIKLLESDETKFDLVILDLTMPIMSGREALSRIMEINEDMRIILSSGYNPTGFIEIIEEYAHVTFLQKPYTLDEFKRALSDHLGYD